MRGGVRWRDEKGLFEGTVSLGFVGGKRRRKTVYGITKTACLEEMDRVRAQARAGTLPGAGKLTVGQLLARWLESTKSKTAPRTLEERERTVNAHLIPRVGSMLLAKLNVLHVEALYADFANDKVAPSSARHAGQCLSAALGYAQKKLREVAVNPAAEVPLPPEPRREMLCLSGAQVRALLAAAKGRPCYPLLALALGSGCRQGEMLGLAWGDLDLDAGTLTVRRALTRTKAGGFALKGPKRSASKRTIVLPTFAVEALNAHRIVQLKAGLIRHPVFCTSSGEFVFRSNVTRALKAVIDRVNDPLKNRKGGRPKKDTPPPEQRERLNVIPVGLRFHDLRHTHASLLLSQGQSLRAVSQRLGHSNPSLMLRVYAHVLPGDDKALAAGREKIVG